MSLNSAAEIVAMLELALTVSNADGVSIPSSVRTPKTVLKPPPLEAT
ncbi:MAG: hypothetical protein NTW75_06305 [Planctomycetales bacterium]|jgi:hypothetical protein|nr:hypothetical protein [Planctomycetales bacterium]